MSLKTIKRRYGIVEDRPIIALAPMAGVSDLPFRTLCESLGADFSVTEMLATAPQLIHSDKNQARLNFTPKNTPKVLQIIGNDIKQMTKAAQHYADQGAQIIDINLGCPAKKVNSKGAGSALLSDLALVKTLLESITKVCPVPVTVKTRLGPTPQQQTLPAVAEIAQDVGIELMTVHGRSRACHFKGQAQFEAIAHVKQRYPNLAILANGDITDLQTARSVLSSTGCDGLMIGRGAIGNPWIFSIIRCFFDSYFSPPDKVTPTQQILQHLKAIHQFYGEFKGVRLARKHLRAYLNFLELNQQFATLAQITDATVQYQRLNAILKHADNDNFQKPL